MSLFLGGPHPGVQGIGAATLWDFRCGALLRTPFADEELVVGFAHLLTAFRLSLAGFLGELRNGERNARGLGHRRALFLLCDIGTG